MRPVLMLVCLVCAGCMPVTSPAPRPMLSQEDQLATQDSSAAWKMPIEDLGSECSMTMRRIDGPLTLKDGDSVSHVLHFNGGEYRILSDQRIVPAGLDRAVRAALIRSLRHTNDAPTLCEWRPGVYVAITRFINADRNQVRVVGVGVICFACGDWDFHFHGYRERFGEHMPHDTYNTLLSTVQVVFPEDVALLSIQPRH